jgi:predicted DNA-binding transcriptional regulator AlpA
MTRRSAPACAPHRLRPGAAAAHVGLGATKFSELVREGRLPQPRDLGGVTVWLREELKAVAASRPGRGMVDGGGGTERAPRASGDDWDEVVS